MSQAGGSGVMTPSLGTHPRATARPKIFVVSSFQRPQKGADKVADQSDRTVPTIFAAQLANSLAGDFGRLIVPPAGYTISMVLIRVRARSLAR